MKKKEKVKKIKSNISFEPKPTKGEFVFKGLITILLGLLLWFNYLDIKQTIAVLLILFGLKKIFYTLKH